MTKPVRVFVIMGQSNTLEMGKVTPNLGELYPFIVDDAGKESVRQDVRNVSVMHKGDKDMRNPAHNNNYEKNLVALIKDLRKTFNAPKAAFVTASLGQTEESDTTSGHGVIMQAMTKLLKSK